jgi:hypothetical protein
MKKHEINKKLLLGVQSYVANIGEVGPSTVDYAIRLFSDGSGRVVDMSNDERRMLGFANLKDLYKQLDEYGHIPNDDTSWFKDYDPKGKFSKRIREGFGKMNQEAKAKGKGKELYKLLLWVDGSGRIVEKNTGNYKASFYFTISELGLWLVNSGYMLPKE